MGHSLLNWIATQGFIPHGYCFSWDANLMWLMVISDVVIALSYYSIPLALLSFLDRRPDIKFSWVFVLFSAFIFMCGTTHIMEVITIWYPIYWIEAWTKFATAGASFMTAILLWPFMKTAVLLGAPAIVVKAAEERAQEEQSKTQTD